MDNNSSSTEPGSKYMCNDSFKDVLVCRAEYAVTVSNVEEQEPRPTIETLLNPEPDSEGEIPKVIFTCTHWQKDSPTISPYPMNGTRGVKYHRLKMRLDDILKDTTLYIEKDRQLDYPSSPGSVDCFNVKVARTDEEKKRWSQRDDHEVLDTDHKNPFIFYDKKKESWFCNEHYGCKYRYFVNLVFGPGLEPTYKWDTVKKTNERTE